MPTQSVRQWRAVLGVLRAQEESSARIQEWGKEEGTVLSQSLKDE